MSLKKIAEELGLSVTTVSRALNNYPEVAQTTRQAVRAAAARLGYQPDARARGLALGRADAVGLVFPFTPGDLGDLQFLGVADAMSAHLADAGMDLLMISAAGRHDLEAYRRTIAGRRVDAFVVPRTHVDDDRLKLLHTAGVPFVAYGRSRAFPAEYAWFDFDNRQGARLATERLLGFGHRALGYLGAPPAYNFADQRYLGFSETLASAGIAPEPQRVRRLALDRRSGYEAMQALLALPEPPSAVLVDNHLAGVGAVHAALHAGRVLGQDLSVIVYDGLGPDSVISAAVTSVEQPTAALAGQTLAEMVLARLHGTAPAELHCLRSPVLVPGGSDGPPGTPRSAGRP